jgi:hypothetical protein
MVSYPTKDEGFLRTIKTYSTPSFRREIKLPTSCRKILWHVEDPDKV